MLVRVETERTKFSKKDMTKALVNAWFKIFEKKPKKEQIGILFAQWSLETGQGQYCWNYNIGNYKAKDIPNKTVKYIALNNVWEIINGKKVILDKEDPGSWFLAFDSLSDGVEEHLRKLSGQRWKLAWEAVVNGDPNDFAHKLKLQRYYTAPEEDYKKLMSMYFKQFMSSSWFDESFDELSFNASDNSEKTNDQNYIEITPISVQPTQIERYEEEPKDFKLTFIQKILFFIYKLFNK